jgi:carbamoyltransferase
VKILGVSGRHREAAAALAVDGRVVAAAPEDCFAKVLGVGYGQTGGFPTHAVEACLAGAGIDFADVDQLNVVSDDGEARPENIGRFFRPSAKLIPKAFAPFEVSVAPLLADAVLAAARGACAVLVCGAHPAAMAWFVRDGETLTTQGPIEGSDGLVAAARALAASLGVPDDDPFQTLDRLSLGSQPEFAADLAEVMRWRSGSLDADLDRQAAFIATVAGRHEGMLADAESLNVHLNAARSALAASFLCRLAQVVLDAATSLRSKASLDSVAFGGALFRNPRFVAELRRLAGEDIALSTVPALAGRALGAALAFEVAPPQQVSVSGLAIGPVFTDTDIKRTLDNCRLDYVYEPDWQRVHRRTSRMLAQGKVVAWFQGAMAFGPLAMGTRSILCDPSARYARHNMNEYLRQAPMDEPLPVVFAPSAAAASLAQPVPVSAVASAAVREEWRDRLTSALDSQQCVRVNRVTTDDAPELCDLLEWHYKSTRVPALIETNLCEPGQPMACTPRDAVRILYSSAIDALIIGRFILMKDYWLLRTDVD